MTDLNKHVESPCRQTGEWGFIGFLQVAKSQEQEVPIGVFSSYADGKAVANAWMQNTGRAIRWEAQKLYAPLEEDLERASDPDYATGVGTFEDPEPVDEDGE